MPGFEWICRICLKENIISTLEKRDVFGIGHFFYFFSKLLTNQLVSKCFGACVCSHVAVPSIPSSGDKMLGIPPPPPKKKEAAQVGSNLVGLNLGRQFYHSTR